MTGRLLMHVLLQLGADVRITANAQARTQYICIVAKFNTVHAMSKAVDTGQRKALHGHFRFAKDSNGCCALWCFGCYGSMADLCLMWPDWTSPGVYLLQNERCFRLWRGLRLKRHHWVHRAIAAGRWPSRNREDDDLDSESS